MWKMFVSRREERHGGRAHGRLVLVKSIQSTLTAIQSAISLIGINKNPLSEI